MNNILNTNYRIESGEYGQAVITLTGRCIASYAATIEGGCCRSYKLIHIPNTAGCVLKALDGTTPATVSITPTTTARSYTCVKVEGRVNPLAPTQPTGSDYATQAILSFLMKYIEVGSVA